MKELSEIIKAKSSEKYPLGSSFAPDVGNKQAFESGASWMAELMGKILHWVACYGGKLDRDSWKAWEDGKWRKVTTSQLIEKAIAEILPILANVKI